jgi:hypothetical protein
MLVTYLHGMQQGLPARLVVNTMMCWQVMGCLCCCVSERHQCVVSERPPATELHEPCLCHTAWGICNEHGPCELEAPMLRCFTVLTPGICFCTPSCLSIVIMHLTGGLSYTHPCMLHNTCLVAAAGQHITGTSYGLHCRPSTGS